MVRPVWKTHDSRTARRRWTIRLKAHGSYCRGQIPYCTSLVPGLLKSQTYVGEVYFLFLYSGAATKPNRRGLSGFLTNVISFRDSAGLKQGNKDRPVSVLRKSAGFGP